MRNGGRWAAVAALVLSVGLTGCEASRTATSASSEQPAQVETISGKDVKQVRLTDQAVKRLGIETTPLESIAPRYLGHVFGEARLEAWRARARRG